MGPEFWQTLMGRKLIEGDIPRIVRSLERIAGALERSNGNRVDPKVEASVADPPDPDNIWYCADCGNENVEVRMWVVANTGELQDDCDEGTAFCPKCQGEVKLDSRPRNQKDENLPAPPASSDEGTKQ